MGAHNSSALASGLAAANLIPIKDLPRFQASAKSQKKNIVPWLVENNVISSKALADFCVAEYGYVLLDLDTISPESISRDLINERLIETYHVLPLYKKDRNLFLACSDPTAFDALDAFGFHFNLNPEMVLVEEQKLAHLISYFLDSNANNALNNSISDKDIDALEVVETNAAPEEVMAADDAPIVKYINKIMLDAIQRGASDLHFEPYEQKYRIRFRIDGLLHEIATPSAQLANRFSARLKVMAKLDIAERRLPQDGRIKLKLSPTKAVDMRVSTLPTLWGEKVVIRLLDSSPAKLDIKGLGFDEKQQHIYAAALERPQGMILVTGPTGSGKTLTLYTGLHILNTPELNISTAEDPIEINLPGINQVQVNPKAGLTFANTLRAFLRQDPDVVMVGEIRDLETAEIAIKASQTGHLVLSTLHTNSAAETLTRLLNMGVAAFNIASSLTLIIAQRLVRKLCPHCKVKVSHSEAELLDYGFSPAQLAEEITLYEPLGCAKCSGGYKGRTAIYEMLSMSENIAKLIMQNGNSLQIAALAQREGMRTLRLSGIEKARTGITSLAEINRVTSK